LSKARKAKEKTDLVKADISAYSSIEAHHRTMLVEKESEESFPPMADKDVMDKILRWKARLSK
jgi:hypothetical protein